MALSWPLRTEDRGQLHHSSPMAHARANERINTGNRANDPFTQEK